MWKHSVWIGLILGSWCAHAQAQQGGDDVEYDILDFTTGITIEEADSRFSDLGWVMTDEQAFVINGTDVEFISSRTYQNLGVEEYQDQILIEFSKPPTEPKVIRIYRDYKPFARLGGNNNFLPLQQMEESLTERYGPAHNIKDATRARVLKWSTDAQAEMCASHSPGAFRVNPSSGRSAVPNCHGLHLSINMQFTPRNIGPVITTVWSDLIDVDEWRINDLRFNKYAIDLQTQKEKQQAESAKAPPL